MDEMKNSPINFDILIVQIAARPGSMPADQAARTGAARATAARQRL